jgi:hypothetical protein
MDHQRRQRRETSAAEATQGAHWEDGKRGTIRAVTPEGQADDISTFASSPPQSPRSHNSHSSHTGNPRNFVARANSADTDYAFRNGRDQGSIRPRGRTLEEKSTRDRSPPNSFVTGRHRIGSVASTSSTFQSLEESVVTSIGHPSTISPQSQVPPRTTSTNSRGRLMKQPPRTTSPVTSPSTAPPDSWGVARARI